MSTQQITILPGEPVIFEGTSSKTGKPYRMVKQAAFLTNAQGQVEAFTWMGDRVDGKNVATPAGKYTLGASAQVRNGELLLAPRLVPVAGAAGGTK